MLAQKYQCPGHYFGTDPLFARQGAKPKIDLDVGSLSNGRAGSIAGSLRSGICVRHEMETE